MVDAAIWASADFTPSVITCVPEEAPLPLPLPVALPRPRRFEDPLAPAVLPERCLTTGSWWMTTPRPAQTSHGSLKVSSRPRPSFLRVICTSPSEEIGRAHV